MPHSPYNNVTIREIHTQHGVNIVGYTATEDEKDEIRELIRQQCVHYHREQDKMDQMTKQTRESIVCRRGHQTLPISI